MMLCLRGFPLVVLGSQPFRVMLEMFFVLFLLCFCRPSISLRPIQSLISRQGLYRHTFQNSVFDEFEFTGRALPL